jgi:hypothetical protein
MARAPTSAVTSEISPTSRMTSGRMPRGFARRKASSVPARKPSASSAL